MLVAERYDKIVDLVNERGSIRVSELSELCGVTEETIRRDLDRLEQQGKLRRSHGGAVSVKETQAEIPYFEREVIHRDEKMRIAKAAVALIEPYDRIALDASSTAWYMASILPDIPLTVLTNSIKVALELSAKEKIEVISTGGILAPRSLSYVGPMAERSLEAYYVDKAFVSCKGVHPERGISESNELQAMVKHKLIKQAAAVYLLADASKIGTQAFTHVAGWEEIGTVITDGHIDAEDARLLKDKGIALIVAAEA
ncbi:MULTISPECIES: DeoR/GlpR family DNA-binding transcription regulator [Paenibacillus]|jgi:DeoR/GlpR family transcriptional regulator of sugar metabolism|uniref:HTH-type transcriptional regulator YulB n=1 Tax=Paenibacillus azoreducens TaxID=116718 RepID=A0A920CRC7_9BACL|nr:MULTISPECIES: DeoR/GlpR family DNA-binding transcription regulator [Paenibacillus]MBE9913844.1 DeoR/GlpR transcriptional regulator [Paenibacillus donghaensis]GIO48130.1 putative HTH-type transcriptional regulator YulB [Paenibacillus azoreducens]